MFWRLTATQNRVRLVLHKFECPHKMRLAVLRNRGRVRFTCHLGWCFWFRQRRIRNRIKFNWFLSLWTSHTLWSFKKWYLNNCRLWLNLFDWLRTAWGWIECGHEWVNLCAVCCGWAGCHVLVLATVCRIKSLSTVYFFILDSRVDIMPVNSKRISQTAQEALLAACIFGESNQRFLSAVLDISAVLDPLFSQILNFWVFNHY